MALIDAARALDDPRFIWRVKAAMLMKAREEFAKTPTTNPAGAGQTSQQSWNMAAQVLRMPMMDEPSMIAMVAIDSAVSGKVKVTAENTVTTEEVPDADIIRVVGSEWPQIAKKY